jgi:hypothetical protein
VTHLSAESACVGWRAKGSVQRGMAEDLAQAGYRPPKQAERLSQQAVREWLQRLGVRSPRLRTRASLGHHEGWLADLARMLSMLDPPFMPGFGVAGCRHAKSPRPHDSVLKMLLYSSKRLILHRKANCDNTFATLPVILAS